MGVTECRWCGGRGCLACPAAGPLEDNLLFEADLSNPGDMELLARHFGRAVMERAFGPGGRGMEEIREHAREARLEKDIALLLAMAREVGSA